ncbi:MAG: FHA domain-containing protein [Byssovorax sp.]
MTGPDAGSSLDRDTTAHRSGVFSRTSRDGSGGWGLVLIEDDGSLSPVALQDGATVGSSSREAMVEGDGVAAQHLRVSVRSDGCYLEDLGSPEGTFVGGVRAHRIGVAHGDVVRLGRRLAVFVERDLRAYVGSITRVGDLLVGPKQKTDWVDPVIELCAAGSCVCIEGGPGTGKRTLALHAVRARGANHVIVIDGAKEGASDAVPRDGATSSSTTWVVLAADRLPRARQVDLMHAVGTANGGQIVATMRAPFDLAMKDGLLSPWFGSLFSGKRVSVPPLQSRREDLPAIVRDLAERRGIGAARLSPELLEALLRAGWPGGVPELDGMLADVAAVITEGPLVPEPIAQRLARPSTRPASLPPAADPTLARARLEDALARANGSVASAARSLGMSRQAIYREAERLGLHVAHRKASRG